MHQLTCLVGLVNNVHRVRLNPLAILYSICGLILICNMIIVLSKNQPKYQQDPPKRLTSRRSVERFLYSVARDAEGAPFPFSAQRTSHAENGFPVGVFKASSFKAFRSDRFFFAATSAFCFSVKTFLTFFLGFGFGLALVLVLVLVLDLVLVLARVFGFFGGVDFFAAAVDVLAAVLVAFLGAAASFGLRVEVGLPVCALGRETGLSVA